MQVEAELIKRSLPDVVDKSPLIAELHQWKQLFSPKLFDRTMIGIMMMFFQRAYLPVFFMLSYVDTFCATNVEWSGINALLYYGPTLMRSLGIRGDTVSLLTSGGIGVVQFLAVFPAILLIDKLGKLYTLVIHSASLTDLKEGRLF